MVFVFGLFVKTTLTIKLRNVMDKGSMPAPTAGMVCKESHELGPISAGLIAVLAGFAGRIA